MPLQPGTVSPIRTVPASIARPEYVGKDRVAPYVGPEVKDAETIELMRIAGRLGAQALAEVPLGRFGAAEDVASLVHWLAAEANYVTGQVFAVDGGMSM